MIMIKSMLLKQIQYHSIYKFTILILGSELINIKSIEKFLNSIQFLI